MLIECIFLSWEWWGLQFLAIFFDCNGTCGFCNLQTQWIPTWAGTWVWTGNAPTLYQVERRCPSLVIWLFSRLLRRSREMFLVCFFRDYKLCMENYCAELGGGREKWKSASVGICPSKYLHPSLFGMVALREWKTTANHKAKPHSKGKMSSVNTSTEDVLMLLSLAWVVIMMTGPVSLSAKKLQSQSIGETLFCIFPQSA